MDNSSGKQRIGQWLWNHIANEVKEVEPTMGMIERIGNRIFQMSDTEFYQLLKQKEKEEYKPMEICTKHHRQLDDRHKCRDCEAL